MEVCGGWMIELGGFVFDWCAGGFLVFYGVCRRWTVEAGASRVG